MKKFFHPDIVQDAATSRKSKVENWLIALAFMVGMTLNIASIAIGNPYIVSGLVLVVCVIATALRGEYQRPWIFLATIVASNPSNLNAPIACNLLFAIVLLMFGPKHLRDLPKWIFWVNILALISITLSSVYWLGNGDVSLKTQIGSSINYLAGPFLLLPVIYSGLAKEEDRRVNLKGILYFIIIPSTVILFMAYSLGTPIKNLMVFEYAGTNLTVFRLWNTLFNFTRTQSGFILASLICASVAVFICQVETFNRALAAGCLLFNIYILLVSGSVGSALAGMCGVSVILLVSMFQINVGKYFLLILLAVILLFSVWNFTDIGIKKYVTNRYEQRFTKKGVDAKDRIMIWKRALGYIVDHPGGVGWNLYIEEIKTYPHNDYFTYAIAYTVLGGIVYLYTLLRIGCSLIMKPRNHVESHHELAVRIAGLGVFVVVILNSATDHMTANRWYFNVIWGMLWFAYFCNRPSIDKAVK